MNIKNSIISICAILIIVLIYFFQSTSHNKSIDSLVEDTNIDATSTQQSIIKETGATSTQPVIEKNTSGLKTAPGFFHYDIVVGKNKCGEKIGTVYITSVIPSEKLYWELQGMKPLWMNVSSAWGETPAQIDMTYNCILSGASNGEYKVAFDVMQTNKDGSKPLHKYLFAIFLNGNITLENQ